MSEDSAIDFAIEIAYNSLIDTAMRAGVALNKPLGLMYLPSQELTENFKVAGRAIIESLKVTNA